MSMEIPFRDMCKHDFIIIYLQARKQKQRISLFINGF